MLVWIFFVRVNSDSPIFFRYQKAKSEEKNTESQRTCSLRDCHCCCNITCCCSSNSCVYSIVSVITIVPWVASRLSSRSSSCFGACCDIFTCKKGQTMQNENGNRNGENNNAQSSVDFHCSCYSTSDFDEQVAAFEHAVIYKPFRANLNIRKRLYFFAFLLLVVLNGAALGISIWQAIQQRLYSVFIPVIVFSLTLLSSAYGLVYSIGFFCMLAFRLNMSIVSFGCGYLNTCYFDRKIASFWFFLMTNIIILVGCVPENIAVAFKQPFFGIRSSSDLTGQNHVDESSSSSLPSRIREPNSLNLESLREEKNAVEQILVSRW